MAKSYSKYHERELKKQIPNRPTYKTYNRGFSGLFEKEFEYSDTIQQKRLDTRSEKYDKWEKSDFRNKDRDPNREADTNYIGAVSSSWITSLGYIMETSEAVATFKGVNAEFYYKMNYDTFLDWLNSPSKGRWLHDHQNIMRNYQVKGGRGSKEMQKRLQAFGNKNGRRTNNNTPQGRGKVSKYLSKWR